MANPKDPAERAHDAAYRYLQRYGCGEALAWRWRRSAGKLRRHGGARWPNGSWYLAGKPRSSWREIMREMRASFKADAEGRRP